MTYFDENGRCRPSEGMRLFSDKYNNYYSIDKPSINYTEVIRKHKKFSKIDDINLKKFESKLSEIIRIIKRDENYSNILNGVHIPFYIKKINKDSDIGEYLEDIILPSLKSSFLESFPTQHFKAVVQGDGELKRNLSIVKGCGYEEFVCSASERDIIGWYFPQALQEFDVHSQREQAKLMNQPSEVNMCLSGGLEIASALIGFPGLLNNSGHYSPILCMSSLIHSDPRLVLLLKSYGPHLEFWCLSQMLTKNVTMVSEQWSGGISIYQSFSNSK